MISEEDDVEDDARLNTHASKAVELAVWCLDMASIALDRDDTDRAKVWLFQANEQLTGNE